MKTNKQLPKAQKPRYSKQFNQECIKVLTRLLRAAEGGYWGKTAYYKRGTSPQVRVHLNAWAIECLLPGFRSDVVRFWLSCSSGHDIRYRFKALEKVEKLQAMNEVRASTLRWMIDEVKKDMA
jgi:hypothetical protein